MKMLFDFVAFCYNYLTLKKYDVVYGKNLKINGFIYLRNFGELVIGDNVTINSGHRFSPIGGSTRSRIICHGKLTIGNNVGLSNSTIFCSDEIKIGNYTLVGGSSNILDTNFHSLKFEERRCKLTDIGSTAPIHIGDDVFIGAHCIILGGTSVKDRDIVPAGAVVRRN